MTIETYRNQGDAALRAHQVAAEVVRISPEMNDMGVGANGTRCLRFREGDAVCVINIMMQSGDGYWVDTDPQAIAKKARRSLTEQSLGVA